jgi:PIN domain nuclease of toxin-antitoxin system
VRPILLDTCALIWLADQAPMSREARASLTEVDFEKGQVIVSPISAWEIGLLVARGRLSLTVAPGDWFREVLNTGIDLAPMPPELLIASCFLPCQTLRDPADRIIAATARHFRYRLMTRDRPLLSFGGEGHLQTIAC